MAAAKKDPLIGKLIGGCRIQSTLGRGGMGVVYKATQERLRAPVALKVIKPEMGLNERAIARFEREAREIAKLRGETNHVVQIFDFGMDEENSVYFISMEMVDGEGVDSLVRRHGGLDEAQAVELTYQAALGLETAREHGMVHRDIKPENLLLNKKGVLKITDFGLAKGLDDQSQQMTADGQALGTPAYMSPEQAEAQELDHRSDIYSLGATLYSLVTGATPYKADSAVTMALQHITAPVPDAVESGYEVSPALNQVIKKSMAKSPDGRFQTAGEMAEALKSIADGRTPGAGPSPQQTLSLMVQPPDDDTMLVIEESSGTAVPIQPDKQPTGDTLDAGAVTALEFDGRTPTPATAAPRATAQRPAAGGSKAPWIVIGLVAAIALLVTGIYFGTRDTGGQPTPVPVPVPTPTPGPTPGPAPSPTPTPAPTPSPVPTPTEKARLGMPDAPEDGAVLSESRVRVKGRLQNTVADGWVRVNAIAAEVKRDLYDATLELPDGTHAISITAGKGDETHDTLTVNVTIDTTAPAVQIAEPAEGAVLGDATVAVKGSHDDPEATRIRINGQEQGVEGTDVAGEVQLTDGRHSIAIEVEDRVGHVGRASVSVTVDTTTPVITLRGGDTHQADAAPFTVAGLVQDATPVAVTVDGAAVEVVSGEFAHGVTLRPGEQSFTVRAEDAAGNAAEATLTVTYVDLPRGLTVGTRAGLYVWAGDASNMVAVGEEGHRFFLDREEVSVARYAKFLAALQDSTPHVPRDWRRQSANGRENRPVVGVSFASAQAYAKWAGKHLPTVEEWMSAAGGKSQKYPWGDAAPSSSRAVFDRDPLLGRTGKGVDPVGAHGDGTGPTGCVDLAGNVAEWTADAGRARGTRIVKGGSWTDPADALRNSASREVAESARLYTLGFRCVVREKR